MLTLFTVQRSPLLGRGYEAYAEDPVLSGTLAAHLINGLQERGVGACIKHYAAHDQTAHGSQDSVLMSQRTLRELHTLPFQVAFAITKWSETGTPWSIMTSYNRINGIHCSEDSLMINGILRNEWNWEGLVMSDFWGTYSTSKSINAGLDLEMPQQIWRGRQLADAVECRKVSLRTVDTAVQRLLQLINRTKAYEPRSDGEDTKQLDTDHSHKLTRKVAAESIVLLKNDKAILPLDKSKKQRYGLIGELFEHPATCGGGGSEVNPFYISKPIDAITEIVGIENVRYLPGCYSKYLQTQQYF
jgi:beta-glucosidase